MKEEKLKNIQKFNYDNAAIKFFSKYKTAYDNEEVIN